MKLKSDVAWDSFCTKFTGAKNADMIKIVAINANTKIER